MRLAYTAWLNIEYTGVTEEDFKSRLRIELEAIYTEMMEMYHKGPTKETMMPDAQHLLPGGRQGG